MKICIIGTGYVGLVSGTCFAELGNNVICVDNDKEKIEKLKNNVIPIYEPGLKELIQRNCRQNRLFFTTNIKSSIRKSDIIFICVGTPTNKTNNIVIGIGSVEAKDSSGKTINADKIIYKKNE